MKICYLKSGDVSDELKAVIQSPFTICGGPEYYTYSIFKKAAGNRLLLVSHSQTNQRYSYKNTDAVVFKLPASNIKLKKLFFIFSFSKRVFLRLKQFKPDIILSTSILNMALPSFIYGKLYGKKFYISVHTDIYTNRYTSWIVRYIIKQSDAIICHGPFLKEQVSTIVKKKKKVLEYRAGCEDMLNNSGEGLNENITKGGRFKTICYHGRIEENKGVFDLLDAAEPFLNLNPDFKLVYAGDGSALNRLKNAVSNKNLSSKVIVLGRISRQQVASLLKTVWVSIAPTQTSLSEGRCMSAIEPLSLGIPIIVPRFGPFLHLVSDGINGMFFKPGCVKDLAIKIRLFKDPVLRNQLARGAANNTNKFLFPEITYSDALDQIIDMSSVR